MASFGKRREKSYDEWLAHMRPIYLKYCPERDLIADLGDCKGEYRQLFLNTLMKYEGSAKGALPNNLLPADMCRICFGYGHMGNVCPSRFPKREHPNKPQDARPSSDSAANCLLGAKVEVKMEAPVMVPPATPPPAAAIPTYKNALLGVKAEAPKMVPPDIPPALSALPVMAGPEPEEADYEDGNAEADDDPNRKLTSETESIAMAVPQPKRARVHRGSGQNRAKLTQPVHSASWRAPRDRPRGCLQSGSGDARDRPRVHLQPASRQILAERSGVRLRSVSRFDSQDRSRERHVSGDRRGRLDRMD